MGLTTEGVAFLSAASRSGVDFSRTLMIGRQAMVSEGRRVRAGMRQGGVPIDLADAQAISRSGRGYCEPLLRHLGALHIDSLDGSGFEGSTIVHDLNQPLPKRYVSQYSVVLDGGTLEHVFDFPTALRSSLEAVALGGHYLAITPANNNAGHGFYQLSPELYFRVLSPENGFRVTYVLWRAEYPYARWYRVADPATVRRRVERRGCVRSLLFVAARRIDDREVLSSAPQQSDYAMAWTTQGMADGSREALNTTMGRLARRTPLLLKDSILLARQIARTRGHAGDFEPVSLSEIVLA